MVRSIVILGLALAAFATPALAQDQAPPKRVHPVPQGPGPLPDPPIELWPGAVTGMTPDEMAQKFPKAQKVYGDTLGNGLIERLRIAPYELDGNAYALKFFFDATAFRQVLLSLQPADPKRDVAATTQACDKRTAALKKEFGEPEHSDVSMATEGEMALSRTYQFDAGTKKVILICLGSKYGTSIVNQAISQPD